MTQSAFRRNASGDEYHGTDLNEVVQAGDRNNASAVAGYKVALPECFITVCDTTSAVTINGGVAGDTKLMGILILKNAGPATATVTGFKKKSNAGVEAAVSPVFSGSTADDRWIPFHGAVNDQGPLTVTASVDELVVVFWWSY